MAALLAATKQNESSESSMTISKTIGDCCGTESGIKTGDDCCGTESGTKTGGDCCGTESGTSTDGDCCGTVSGTSTDGDSPHTKTGHDCLDVHDCCGWSRSLSVSESGIVGD